MNTPYHLIEEPYAYDRNLTLSPTIATDLPFVLGDQIWLRVAVIGRQKQGKSTIINELFGLNFASSALSTGRTTRGSNIALTSVNHTHESKSLVSKIVCSDSEGIFSTDRTKEAFDDVKKDPSKVHVPAGGSLLEAAKACVNEYSWKHLTLLTITHNIVIWVYKQDDQLADDLEKLTVAVKHIKKATDASTVGKLPILYIVWNQATPHDIDDFDTKQARHETHPHLEYIKAHGFKEAFHDIHMVCLPSYLDNSSGGELADKKQNFNQRLESLKGHMIELTYTDTPSTLNEGKAWVGTLPVLVDSLNKNKDLTSIYQLAREKATELLETALTLGKTKFTAGHTAGTAMTTSERDTRKQDAQMEFESNAPRVDKVLLDTYTDMLQNYCSDKWNKELRACDKATGLVGCSHNCALPINHTSKHDCLAEQRFQCSGKPGFVCPKSGNAKCSVGTYDCGGCHSQCRHRKNCIVAGNSHSEHHSDCCCTITCAYHSKICIQALPHVCTTTTCTCDDCCTIANCACGLRKCVLTKGHTKAHSCNQNQAVTCNACGKSFNRMCGTTTATDGCYLSTVSGLVGNWHMGNHLMGLELNNGLRVHQGTGPNQGWERPTYTVVSGANFQFTMSNWHHHVSMFTFYAGQNKIEEFNPTNGSKGEWVPM